MMLVWSKYPVFAHQHFGDNSFQVVIDAPLATATKEFKGADMSVKYHLQGLAGVGYTKRHPAVTETQVGYFDLNIGATKLNPLIAPVKLKRIAWFKEQRDEGVDYSLAATGLPVLYIPADAVVTTLKSFPL